jgi:hypothetical protein
MRLGPNRACDADRHGHGRHDEAGHKIVPQQGRLVRTQRVPPGKPVFPAGLIRLHCIAGDATKLGGMGRERFTHGCTLTSR